MERQTIRRNYNCNYNITMVYPPMYNCNFIIIIVVKLGEAPIVLIHQTITIVLYPPNHIPRTIGYTCSYYQCSYLSEDEYAIDTYIDNNYIDNNYKYIL